jgi:hypothetical protein
MHIHMSQTPAEVYVLVFAYRILDLEIPELGYCCTIGKRYPTDKYCPHDMGIPWFGVGVVVAGTRIVRG